MSAAFNELGLRVTDAQMRALESGYAWEEWSRMAVELAGGIAEWILVESPNEVRRLLPPLTGGT